MKWLIALFALLAVSIPPSVVEAAGFWNPYPQPAYSCRLSVEYRPAYRFDCNPYYGCRLQKTYQPRLVLKCRRPVYDPPIRISPIEMYPRRY